MSILILDAIIYYIFLFLVIIISQIKKINNNKVFLKGLVLFLLFYFYYSILGLDYYSYKRIFDWVDVRMKYNIMTNPMEPIFFYIIYFTKKFNFSFECFILLIKSIPLLINYFFIKKFSKRKLESFLFLLLINFIAFYCDALRQNISASIFLLSIYFFSNKKIKTSIIFWIISVFCHYSAAFFIFIFILSNFFNKITHKTYIKIIISTMLFSFFVYRILVLLNLHENSDRLVRKIGWYVQEKKTLKENWEIIKIIFFDLMMWTKLFNIVIINSFLLKYRNNFNNFKKEILKLGTAASILSSLFVFTSEIMANRFNLTFCFGFYLLISDLPKYKRLILIILLLFSDIFTMGYYKAV